MQPSSIAYSASLEPTRRGRAIVAASGVALSLAGWLPIATLPGPPGVRAAVAAAWTVFGCLESVRRRRAIRHVVAYAISADGGLVLRRVDGTEDAAELLPGTIVLGRAIWLRFRDSRGRTGAELIPGDPRRQRDFRRVLVLLRLAPFRQEN